LKDPAEDLSFDGLSFPPRRGTKCGCGNAIDVSEAPCGSLVKHGERVVREELLRPADPAYADVDVVGSVFRCQSADGEAMVKS